MNDNYMQFGHQTWSKFTAQPLGSLTKRELEIILLQAAIGSSLLAPTAESLAISCKIPITRAHGYLTDLALRKPALTDVVAVKSLVGLLKISEIVQDAAYFSIPLQDAGMRIWLERKMALLHLNSGETIRRDQVKLTPAGLVKIIGRSDGIDTPFEAIRKLPPELEGIQWVKTAKKTWKKGMAWPDAMTLLGNTASIAQTVLPNLLGI